MDAATTAVTLFELFGKWPLANRLFQRFLGATTGKGGLVTSMELGKWPPPTTGKREKREKERRERENEKKQKRIKNKGR